MADEQAAELLSEFSDAIERGDYDTAADVIDDLAALYNEVSAEEVELEQKAMAVREREELTPEERANLESFLQAKAAAQFQRNGLLSGAMALHLGEDADDMADVDDLAESAKDLEEQEEVLVDSTATATETIEDKAVPANVNISSISTLDSVPIDSPFDITVYVQNVGDVPAEEVVVEAVPGSKLSLPTSTKTVGEVPGEHTDSVTFTAVAEESGSSGVTFKLNSGDAGRDTETVDLSINPDADTSPISRYTNEEGIVTTDGLRDAIDDWRNDEIDTDLLRDVIDAWRTG